MLRLMCLIGRRHSLVLVVLILWNLWGTLPGGSIATNLLMSFLIYSEIYDEVISRRWDGVIACSRCYFFVLPCVD